MMRTMQDIVFLEDDKALNREMRHLYLLTISLAATNNEITPASCVGTL